MKAIRAAFLALVLGAVSAGGASAVELRNLDSQNHTVKITSPTLNKEYEFRAMSLSLVICVDKCKFEVPGVGSVFASRDDIVTIEAGKVTMESAAKK